VNNLARLTGRNLEPWRALLAVARWLDDRGVAGLCMRLEQLSIDYQLERTQLETDDFTTLILRGLVELCANYANCANCANHLEVAEEKHWLFSACQLADTVVELVKQGEHSIHRGNRLSQRIGMTLSKLRLRKPSRPGGQGNRHWLITTGELQRWSLAYGIHLPTESTETQNPRE
jgi:hypothetical protein